MAIISNPTSPSFSKALEIKRLLSKTPVSLKQLKHVHALLFRFNLHQDNYLLNLFFRLCFNLGHTFYARLIFDQTNHPNVFLWNTLLHGLVSNDCFAESLQFYRSMRKEGFFPTNFTLPFVLKSCIQLSEFQLGMTVHTLAVKAGFDADVSVNTSFVSLYSKCGNFDYAFKVFDENPEKNFSSWSAIITGFIGIGRCKEAIDMFVRLLEMGMRPDSYTLVRVLSACVQIGDLPSGELIDRCATRMGIERNLFVATSLVDLYAKFGVMEKARHVFDQMPERDIVAWSIMIQGYASNGSPKDALDLFFKMLHLGFEPDRYSMVGFLCACARLGALELGDWASKLITRDEFLVNPVLGTALVDMYAKCGSMTKAWEVFRGVSKKDQDRVLWNATVSGLAMNGHVKTAFGLFGQMEKCGIQPDENTFLGLLCASAHAGLVQEGRKFFQSMNSVYAFNPTIEHYGCMVDILGRAGLLEEAHQLIKSMPMKPNAVVWGALLGGCRLHKNTQMAEHVAKQLIQLEPWNSGNYVLLSNIYSAGHKWEDASDIRLKMIDESIKKVPACSWIEVNGVVHEFLVDDMSHPLSEMIYAKLGELGKEIRVAGYMAMKDNVMFDIE